MSPASIAPTNSSKRLSTKELGTFVALGSFAMLFGTLLLAYWLTRARFSVWPPVGDDPIDPNLPILSTAAIFASSCLLELARKKFEALQKAEFRRYWMIGIVLGLVFLGIQSLLWKQMWSMGLDAKESLFGALFYVLTGTHALHVLMALLALGLVAGWSRKDSFFKPSSESPKLAALAWHFLGIVWLVMLGMVIL